VRQAAKASQALPAEQGNQDPEVNKDRRVSEAKTEIRDSLEQLVHPEERVQLDLPATLVLRVQLEI